MSEEIRKDGVGPGRESREGAPQDTELYTPQGGGGGTGSGPIQEPPAIRRASETLEPEKKGVVLPQIGPEGATAQALGLEGEGGEGGQQGPSRPEASFVRLFMTLTLAGALAGALLVFVFLWSDPRIQAYKAMVLDSAIQEVLAGPASYETVFLLQDSTLTAQLPAGVDSMDASQVLDKVYLGYDAAGEPVGFAIQGGEPGFQDIITLIFGYNPQNRQVLAMKVLDHAETPGLGDKIIKDTLFVAEFQGVEAPIQGVKPDRNTGDPAQVDMITGATISSRAVIAIINHRIEALGALLEAYVPTGGVPAEEPTLYQDPGSTAQGAGSVGGNGSRQEERP